MSNKAVRLCVCAVICSVLAFSLILWIGINRNRTVTRIEVEYNGDTFNIEDATLIKDFETYLGKNNPEIETDELISANIVGRLYFYNLKDEIKQIAYIYPNTNTFYLKTGKDLEEEYTLSCQNMYNVIKIISNHLDEEVMPRLDTVNKP